MERTQQRINLRQLKSVMTISIYATSKVTLIYATALSNEADLVSILLSEF
jgi:hypothetical protein